VGHQIWVINHLEDDSRIALASTKEGGSLGVLRAHPPWHRTPHSLTIRSSINSMVRNRRFSLANGADAVTAFMDFVEANPKGKLPIHPSYLELKRLIIEHAQFRSENTEVEVAKARLQQTRSAAREPAADGLGESNPIATVLASVSKTQPSGSKTSLPPLRKAAN
jgi:hypothetical protein